MAVQSIVEETLIRFPELKATDILLEIDRIQKEIANRTKSLTDVGELSTPSSNVSWSLPSTCKEVTGVELYDSNDFSLELDDVNLQYAVEFGNINFYSSQETTITSLGDSVDSAYITFIKIPATIDSESDTLELDESIHFGVIAGVLKTFYSRIPTLMIDGARSIDWRAVSYWDKEIEKAVVEGRKLANTAKDSSPKQYTYNVLGEPKTIKRQKRSDLSGAVAVTPLMAIYSKYVRFTATEGGSITINLQFGWDAAIATPTETSYTITVVSTAEFTTAMFDNSTLAVNSGYSDTSTWTFEMYSGYSSVTCEIWAY